MVTIIDIKNYLDRMDIPFEYIGARELIIKDYSSLNNLKPNAITWIKDINQDVLIQIPISYDMLIVTGKNDKINTDNYNLIICENPKVAFFTLLNKFWSQETPSYISHSAIIESKKIGNNVSIGHNCFIGQDVIIDDDVRIFHNVVIIGKVFVGKRTRINSGTVIGSDGFGYFKDSNGKNVKVDHFGGVIIGEDVEIGSNTCIDRGTLDNTIIGNNCKIDNLCHIGHNCILEEGVLLIALSQLGGSSHLKENAHIAPSASIMNQVTIGANSIVGLGSVVTKDVPDNKVVAGVPAKVLRDNR